VSEPSNLPYTEETVLGVHHWNDQYFSVRTTRPAGLRFENGEFLMLGVRTETKPVLRAYSIASANWEEELNFLSIHVPDGALTSRLAKVQVGDKVLVGKKPTGTLLISDLKPGRVLYLVGTGTGLAPWLSIVKDPDTYERFEYVVVVHGVRRGQDLVYYKFFTEELAQHEILGNIVKAQLLYVPSVTQEDVFGILRGRTTDIFADGSVSAVACLPPPDPELDRVMLCGGPQMLQSWRELLDEKGWKVSPRIGVAGTYVFERAFVEK